MALHLLSLFALIACKGPAPVPPQPLPDEPAELPLPAALQGLAVALDPGDPAAAAANLAGAVKPPGQGGVSAGLVIQLTQDLPVYRLWSGPEKTDDRGYTNRMGSWWAYEAPAGPVAEYRADYAICTAWNDLTWVATCTLQAGAVVVIGPGQSVSAEVCGDASGQEAYPANPEDWQLYVDKAWSRPELACPPETSDYAANPQDLSQPLGP